MIVEFPPVATVRDMIRAYVKHVVAYCGGNKSHAAKILGIDRRSVYRWLEECGSNHLGETHEENDQEAKPQVDDGPQSQRE